MQGNTYAQKLSISVFRGDNRHQNTRGLFPLLATQMRPRAMSALWSLSGAKRMHIAKCLAVYFSQSLKRLSFKGKHVIAPKRIDATACGRE
jgi:hypothetical protein